MSLARGLTVSITLLLMSCGATTPRDGDLTAGGLPKDVPTQGFTSPADSSAVLNGWLKTFNDQQLEKLVAEAVTNNPDLAVMSARLDQAASRARQAGADLKPQVSLAAGAATGGTGNAANTEQMGAGLTMSWELDVWGRISSGVAAAKAEFVCKSSATFCHR